MLALEEPTNIYMGCRLFIHLILYIDGQFVNSLYKLQIFTEKYTDLGKSVTWFKCSIDNFKLLIIIIIPYLIPVGRDWHRR